jgi:SAM-dependent methyltransferase
MSRFDPRHPCPLCGETRARLFCLDGLRGWRYRRCPACRLTWRDAAQRPDAATERGQYELHENDADDAGYRRFLARVAEPLLGRLPAAARGLDYGCGPGPALARMLEAAGHRIALYDAFFHPDEAVLAERYDFVTCTETAEHFFEPGREFERLAGLLRPGGLLAIMTGRLDDDARFGRWHYRHDPTHVCFYRPETLDWIATRHRLTVVYRHGDVWIGQRVP